MDSIPKLDPASLKLLLELLDLVGTHGRDLETLLEEFLRRIITASAAERGTLLLADGKGELEPGPAFDRQGKPIPPLVGISHSLPQEAVRRRSGICRIDQPEQTRTVARTASMEIFNIRSVLCVPLLTEGGVLGVLYLDSEARIRAFSQRDLDRLQTLCSHLALHIENTRFWEERRRQAESRRRALEEENLQLRRRLGERHSLIGESPALERTLHQVGRVAATDATVLLLGETGTGKESMAHLIHASSPRANKPFVIIDAGTIPETLLESELFGHEKGSFTGADQRKIGKFELADGGTIFLDEVGDLPQALQGKLLRVLEQRTIERVGSARPIPVDIRVVAATNRDLEVMSAEGTFRSDLYFRLNVVKIELPPLRDRGEDRLLLAEHFLGAFIQEYGREELVLSRSARKAVVRHDWPGNVREMKHRVQRAAILAEGPEITPESLDLESGPTDEVGAPEVRLASGLEKLVHRSIEEGGQALWSALVEPLEAWLIRTAMVRAGGNQAAAARLLGMDRRRLARRESRLADLDRTEPEIDGWPELRAILLEGLDLRGASVSRSETQSDLIRELQDRILRLARDRAGGSFRRLQKLIGLPPTTLRRRLG